MQRAQLVRIQINSDNDVVERQRDDRPNNNCTSVTKTKTSFARFVSSTIGPIAKPAKRKYVGAGTLSGEKP